MKEDMFRFGYFSSNLGRNWLGSNQANALKQSCNHQALRLVFGYFFFAKIGRQKVFAQFEQSKDLLKQASDALSFKRT